MSAPTILLLDDDEVLRQVLHRVLSRQGLNVVEAGDLAQARQVLEKQPCQLGLFDLCLPDGDGVELAREIQESGSHMPLILMTAYPLRLREQPNLAEKFSRVLSKPVNLQELRTAVDDALAGTAPAAVAPPVPAPPDKLTATATTATVSPAPVAASAPPTDGPLVARPGSLLRPILYGVGSLVVVAAVVYFFFPDAYKLFTFNKAGAGEPGVRLDAVFTAKGVDGDANAIELSKEVVEQLKVKTAVVEKATAHRPLQLAGSLALDPDKLTRVRARFSGEVIRIENASDPNTGKGTKPRPLQFGDHVDEDQLLGVLYSKDLGEKKSELVDALSQLRLDKEGLQGIEDLAQRGASSEVTVRQARRNVEQDQIAVSRAERTLRTWQLPESEIEEVKKEAERVIARKGERDAEKEKDWARVDLKARIAGTIVEKNLSVGDIVDTTNVLFQIADMSRMKVWVNVPEEDLPLLRAAKEAREAKGEKLTWQVRFVTDPTAPPIDGEVEAISPLIDPTQHTAVMMGWVNNPKNNLRSSQFVSATIGLPEPANTVAVPAAALIEDGTESVVFVQPDLNKNVFSMRRVVVTKRFNDQAQIKCQELTKEEVAKGLSPLTPGERVVTVSALEMRSALDDVKAKEKK